MSFLPYFNKSRNIQLNALLSYYLNMHPSQNQNISFTLEALSKSKFRSSFHLKEKERSIAISKGSDTLRQHAFEIINNRIAAAFPDNDGKQTPFKNHPIFVAQHATATCCRKCLQKWHHIPKGRELSRQEMEYIVNLLISWINKEIC